MNVATIQKISINRVVHRDECSCLSVFLGKTALLLSLHGNAAAAAAVDAAVAAVAAADAVSVYRLASQGTSTAINAFFPSQGSKRPCCCCYFAAAALNTNTEQQHLQSR